MSNREKNRRAPVETRTEYVEAARMQWSIWHGMSLLMLAFGCGGLEPQEASDQDAFGQTKSSLITIQSSSGAVTSGTCDSNNARVTALYINELASPWQTMSASGSWSVSGASGVHISYSLDGSSFQSDSTVAIGTSGGWKVDRSILACREAMYKLKLCAYPKIQSSTQETVCWARPICVEQSFYACPNAVGVIPSTDYCPPGTERVSILMDDEDASNSNARTGWYGTTVSTANTRFIFCKVDGRQFRPLSHYDEIQWHYAVLKLGVSCPAEATEFARRVDNENANNDNSSTGSIWPNESSRASTYTKFRYCLFRNAASSATPLSSFPSLDISYGVFAGGSFSSQFALGRGYVVSDDEDDANSSSYWYPSNAPPNTALYAQQIILPLSGTRTMYRMARVR